MALWPANTTHDAAPMSGTAVKSSDESVAVEQDTDGKIDLRVPTLVAGSGITLTTNNDGTITIAVAAPP